MAPVGFNAQGQVCTALGKCVSVNFQVISVFHREIARSGRSVKGIKQI